MTDTDTVSFYEESNGFADYQRIWGLPDNVRVNRWADLHKAENVIKTARQMYLDLGQKHLAKNGDMGTCVLGNGIYVAVKPPRARNLYRLCIATSVGQSDSASYACKDPVLAYLKDNGIDAWYEHGRMD